jgi:hypothetical protein
MAAELIIPLVTLYSSETNAFFSDVPSDYQRHFYLVFLVTKSFLFGWP